MKSIAILSVKNNLHHFYFNYLINYLKDKITNIIRLIFKLVICLIAFSILVFTYGCAGDQAMSQNTNYENYSYQSTGGQDPKSNIGSLTVENKPAEDIIHAGDQVQIMVWGYPEFNTTATVKEFGTVTIPLVGELMAAGLSKDDFTKAVKERLSEYVKGDPQITVSHIAMDKRVSVMGAVNKQDNYPVLTEEPLVEIIAAAGGPSTGADMQHVKIFRKGSNYDVVEVDLTRHLENGNIQSIPKVRPGDTVFVPKEENVMREMSGYARDVLLLFGFFRILY